MSVPEKERLPGASCPGIATSLLRMAVPPRIELAQTPALVSSANPHKETPCIIVVVVFGFLFSAESPGIGTTQASFMST